jgi:glycosyltransferase involved in cell wall biosynthesis
MAERVRVLALIDGASVTGPARNLIGFAQRAREAGPDPPGAEIRIATVVRGDPEANGLVQAIRQAGLPLDIIPERRAFDPGILPRLRDAVERFRPQILQTHNYKFHFLVRFAGLARGAVWLAFHHGYTATKPRVRLYNQLDRWSLRAAARVVTVCRPFARELERRGVPGGRISIQHNSVPPFEAPPEAETAAWKQRLGIPAESLVTVAVGRLSKEKAHADLLEALAALRRQRPSLAFRAIVAGDGPERGNLARRAAALDLDRVVIFAGQQADVKPCYALADVFVLPSHTEGSPNALLEAMAAGKAIVAAAVGGVPEIVRDGETALLFPAGRIESLARAIARLLEDRALARRLGAAARIAAAAYTPEAYCRAILGIYRELAPAPNQAPGSGAPVAHAAPKEGRGAL